MNDRLTKPAWIRQGLRTLANDGPSGLKVGPMSARLQVSRGSFYWHFRDIADFRSQLLQSWREISTEQVIEDLAARQGESGRLKRLMRRALNGGRRLDRAVRSWAAQDEEVAAVVVAVDARRIAGIAKLLFDAGVECERATHRATFLYWAYLGQAAGMDPRHAVISTSALDEISDRLERA